VKPVGFRNKRRECLKKLRLNKNIRYVYRGTIEFRNGYQPRTNIIEDEKEYLLAVSPQYFGRMEELPMLAIESA
jgi:hypothetical protein